MQIFPFIFKLDIKLIFTQWLHVHMFTNGRTATGFDARLTNKVVLALSFSKTVLPHVFNPN